MNRPELCDRSPARQRGAVSNLLRGVFTAGLVLATTALASASDSGSSVAPLMHLRASAQAGGGGKSSGGRFALEGTIGQVVAAPMEGGTFRVRSGFIPMCLTDCELGDIDCDGSVSGSDLGILLLLFGECPDPYGCVGDIDNNGEVDAGDIAMMLVLWH